MKTKQLSLAAVCWALALGLTACRSSAGTSSSRTIEPPATITPQPPAAASPSMTATVPVVTSAPAVASPTPTASATASALAAASTTPSVTPTQGPPPIGDVERKTDVVEHGSSASGLAPLLGSASLFQGDILKIHDGGEGLLTFGNQLTLQLFNDSQLGVVSSSPPGTPLDIQIALMDGGFTGQLTPNGGRAVFTTPGGAQITILGTDFLIAYDPATHVTTAGNFHGTVQVAAAGVQMGLPSGSAVVVPAQAVPGAQFPVTFTEAQFQQQARALKSPVLAAYQNTAQAGSATLAVSDDHACALTASGSLACWGNNANGQLGDGTTTASAFPVEVVGLPGRVVQVAIASTETCAVIQDGTALCWGSNINATSEISQSAKPLPLTWPSGPVLAVAPGNGYTCVLTTKGGVECQGGVSFGQTSDGSLTSGAVAITTGLRDHTCALMAGGGVRCWGYAPHGELGNGVDGDSKAPVDVIGLKEPVTAVVAGENHTCALTVSGGVLCWGYNLDNQLGNASVDTSTNTPVGVQGLDSGVVAVTASHNHTCALTTGGAVKCWGSDHLGDGKTITSATPVDVSGLGRGVAAIAAGGANTCALLTNGLIRCWGDNTLGQLGDGTTTSSQVPVNVFGFGPPS